MMYQLQGEDYVKLWMCFQNRADNIKETMFKSLTWIIGFAAALLAFIGSVLIDFDKDNASVQLLWVVCISASAGLVICVYSFVMLSEFSEHIKSNWKSAGVFKEKIKELKEMFPSENEKPFLTRVWKTLMRPWNQLRIVVSLFTIGFVGILCWALLAL